MMYSGGSKVPAFQYSGGITLLVSKFVTAVIAICDWFGDW